MAFFILFCSLLCGCELEKLISENLNSEVILQDTISPEDIGLTVSFIDVGQGDSTLIECGEEAMLIDAGLYGERNAVCSYLSNRDIESLNYCVATHPHADHIGGMSEVIYRFDVDTLVYPICDNDSEQWNYVLDACDEKGVSYFNPQPGDSFTLGDATITLFSPSKKDDYDNLNNYSMVLKLEYGDISFLFTGDAEKEVEKSLVSKGFDLRADVLKCGHHGSSTSTCKTFLEAVNPAAAVISCGKDNEYGHPHKETIESLNKKNIQVFRTDLSSTIVAQSNGKKISFASASEALGEVVPTSQPATTTATSAVYQYIGNKNSKVFHNTDCGAIDTMKDKNKVYFHTKDEAITEGYKPCEACNS